MLYNFIIPFALLRALQNGDSGLTGTFEETVGKRAVGNDAIHLGKMRKGERQKSREFAAVAHGNAGAGMADHMTLDQHLRFITAGETLGERTAGNADKSKVYIDAFQHFKGFIAGNR